MEDKDKTIEVMKAAMQKENIKKNSDFDTMISDDNNNVESCESAINETEDITKEIISEDEACHKDICEEEEEQNDETDFIAADEKHDKPEKHEKQGKSLFKGTKNKELAAKDMKIEELTDRLMRSMAEFDNFRKRTEKEKAQMFELGAKSIIERMLPIIDNFERGLSSVGEEKESAFFQGFELIYKQLLAVMDEIGVKPIVAVGEEFDPAYHNAVMHGEDENYGENIVSEEFQKGYMYHDIVIRHSMVKVVN